MLKKTCTALGVAAILVAGPVTTASAADTSSTTVANESTTGYTSAQRNAISKAQSYLRFTSFSRSGLIDQLVFDRFSRRVATFAVDHITVSWKTQAYKKAKSYLRFTSFSLPGLIDQLEFDGFTPSQARYGANRAY